MSYGITSYGSGWRKDVVKGCLECARNVTSLLPQALIQTVVTALCVLSVYAGWLSGCLEDVLLEYTRSVTVGMLVVPVVVRRISSSLAHPFFQSAEDRISTTRVTHAFLSISNLTLPLFTKSA